MLSKLYEKYGQFYIISLSHRIDRHNAIKKQLCNVGIQESMYQFHYATAFPHNDIIANAFNVSKRGRFTTANEYDCARNHYSVVKEAYDLGKEYVLIIEDDIRFINDKDIWNNFIDNIPDNFDILQFGGFTTDVRIQKYMSENSFWYTHKDVGLWNASMYILSRKGMEFYIAFMNKFFWVADGPLYKAPINDHILSCYAPSIPLVIQADKDQISSDLRDKTTDSINYNTDNIFEKNIDLMKYFPYWAGDK